MKKKRPAYKNLIFLSISGLLLLISPFALAFPTPALLLSPQSSFEKLVDTYFFVLRLGSTGTAFSNDYGLQNFSFPIEAPSDAYAKEIKIDLELDHPNLRTVRIFLTHPSGEGILVWQDPSTSLTHLSLEFFTRHFFFSRASGTYELYFQDLAQDGTSGILSKARLTVKDPTLD